MLWGEKGDSLLEDTSMRIRILDHPVSGYVEHPVSGYVESLSSKNFSNQGGDTTADRQNSLVLRELISALIFVMSFESRESGVISCHPQISTTAT